jgi:hypothetical protein
LCTRGHERYSDFSTSQTFYLQILHFQSGAEGIRTPDPRRVVRVVWCTTRVEKSKSSGSFSHVSLFLPAKPPYYRIEPMGFEPTPSAVPRQIRWFTGVVDNSQTRLNEPTPPLAYPDKRLCISLHRCRTGVPAAARSKAATGSLEERCGIFARANWGWNSAWLSSWRSPVLIGSTVDFSRGTFVKPLRTRLPRPSSEPRW